MDLEQQILDEVKECVHKSVIENLTKYNGPLANACSNVVAQHQGAIESMLNTAVADLITAPDFKDAMNTALKQKLAKVLVGKFGGELESTINKLKADPQTRAKMVLAVDSVINDLTK